MLGKSACQVRCNDPVKNPYTLTNSLKKVIFFVGGFLNVIRKKNRPPTNSKNAVVIAIRPGLKVERNEDVRNPFLFHCLELVGSDFLITQFPPPTLYWLYLEISPSAFCDFTFSSEENEKIYTAYHTRAC